MPVSTAPACSRGGVRCGTELSSRGAESSAVSANREAAEDAKLRETWASLSWRFWRRAVQTSHSVMAGRGPTGSHKLGRRRPISGERALVGVALQLRHAPVGHVVQKKTPAGIADDRSQPSKRGVRLQACVRGGLKHSLGLPRVQSQARTPCFLPARTGVSGRSRGCGAARGGGRLERRVHARRRGALRPHRGTPPISQSRAQGMLAGSPLISPRRVLHRWPAGVIPASLRAILRR